MIIARSPLRVSLGGGGTDLASYYSEYGGFLIAGAINKYVYVTIMRPFIEGIFLKYSELEKVSTVDEIKHRIIREALRMQQFRTPQIEITTLADIPAGTGLGSSSSFTTALVRALYAHRRRLLLPHELAELACQIEIDLLKEPIGKQDQYISAYGGVACFTFEKDGRVIAEQLNMPFESMLELEDRLMLFFTGFARNAGSILKDQKERSQQNDPQMLDNLHYIKDLGYRGKAFLEKGGIDGFGHLMHEHWEYKKKRSTGMSNPQIDSWYTLARDNGAIGGKLVGAGGGGFLMFVAEDKNRLRKVLTESGMEEVRFMFDFEGSKAVMS